MLYKQVPKIDFGRTFDKEFIMTNANIILNSDSYKYSTSFQYPTGTEVVYSYIESRGGPWPETVFFGLQAFIKQYLLKPITMEDINEAEAIITAHGEPYIS